ncbi:alpha/beta fold hydrolase [Mycobacterium sp. 050134]|uniref:alpha/beta fold hydrolase n=1 Tax=Mycobacterium sp. 050134 TaxID=3096111 RepID=UPI002EDB4B29
MGDETAGLIDAHRSAGHFVDVGGLRTFVRDEGSGSVPVVCLHGVPVSSFLWRRLLPELAGRGLRGLAPDLPGLGLSGRPVDFDYSWTGLGRHLSETLDALDVERFHLVVHDFGGPVGFEIAARAPERVASLTILNTVVEAHTFRPPPPMRPFAWPVLDRVWLATGRGPVFRLLMRATGLSPDSPTTDAEIMVHQRLLLGPDGARAFRRMMRGLETTRAKTELYAAVVASTRYPVQVVWGVDDPFLTLNKHGRIAARMAGLDRPTALPGRHFFPEDSYPQLADRIVALTERAGSR